MKRESSPLYSDINEYVPSSCISIFVPSQMVKNVYLLSKLNPDKEWCDPENIEYNFDVELCKPTSYSYGNSGGNYGGVTNTPIVQIYNHTNYANYSRRDNYTAGQSAGYQQSYYPDLNTDYQQLGML